MEEIKEMEKIPEGKIEEKGKKAEEKNGNSGRKEENGRKQRVILSVKHLSKDFRLRSNSFGGEKKTLHALSDVSIDIFEGETLGIIGESGCGKSTFGKCLVRLHEPTGGDVEYEGKSILKLKGKELKKIRRDLQMVFQDPFASLDPRQEAGKIIAEPMVIHGTQKDAAKREELVLMLMREVGLDAQHVHRFPHEFSGGQRQRINVARALALNPKIIVCDEPVSALDVSVQAQVLNLLKDVQEKYNLTYIFISHDLGVIKHISDRVAIMYLGRIVELCGAQEIYREPLHPYTRALLSAIPPESPFEKKEEIELKGEIPSPIGEMKGCPLSGRCPNCMEECLKVTPELKEVKPGHSVACLMYRQGGHE